MLDAGQNIITRHLPKTGQVTSYRAGDDGVHEAGWWRGRLNANNRQRWIEKEIGPALPPPLTGDIVLDRATGLMWPKDWSHAGTNDGLTLAWNAAIDWANALNWATFTDWRLPNIAELHSLVEFAGASPLYYSPPFVNIQDNDPGYGLWSSTTDSINTDKAYVMRFALGSGYGILKTDANINVIAVRKGV